jgi:hypothetical protein
MSTRSLFGVMAATILLAFAMACPFTRGENRIPEAMTGSWKGGAQIIVVWCKQTNLQMQLHIKPDGQVTGRIGDATFRNGQFGKNRGSLGRKLNLKTDYIITGDLEGPIIAAEKISRRSVSIPLNMKDGVFTGGLHTSGTHVGGKKSMVLSAASLELEREAADRGGKNTPAPK